VSPLLPSKTAAFAMAIASPTRFPSKLATNLHRHLREMRKQTRNKTCTCQVNYLRCFLPDAPVADTTTRLPG
jgi:hypothetical protein